MATPSSGRPRGRPPYPLLTPAEERVLQQLRRGLTNAEIAERLGVTLDAVKYHVSNMLGKLQVENREQLAAWREPSGVRRAWAGVAGLGWKVAVAGGLAAVAAVALFALVNRDSGSSPEPAFAPEDLFVGTVSTGMGGAPADGASMSPSISGDGRLIAFESEATNLVPNDTNGVSDIFVFDRLTKETRRVSMGMNGAEANGASHRPSISADGKWVAFDSEASNLVPDDVNGELDRAVGHLPEETQASIERALSASGRSGFAEIVGSWGGSDVFAMELTSGVVDLVSVTADGEQGNLGSFAPSLSEDGRYVAFESLAPNLAGQVPASAHSLRFVGVGTDDVYLRDRTSRTTTRLSMGKSSAVDEARFGSGLPVVTPDGDHVAFVSWEWRLTWNKPDETPDHTQTTYYVWSRGSGRIREVPVPQPETEPSFPILGGRAWPPAISEDGKRVAFGYEAGALPSSVLGVFYHSDGDERPTLIKGTDEPPGAAAFGLSFDGDKVILALVENGTPRLVEANPAGSWSNVPVPATFEGLFGGRVSADRKWLVAVDLDADAPPRLGAPQSDVVVFPR